MITVPDREKTLQQVIAEIRNPGYCLRCGKPNPSAKFDGFCSRMRRAMHHNGVDYKGINAPCPACGKIFFRTRNRKYCTPECETLGEAYAFTTQFRILERDFFRCVYCGKSSIEDGAKLCTDHIIPASKGGPNHASNIVTACSDCNGSKSARILKPGVLKRVRLLVAIRCMDAHINPLTVVKF